MSEAAMSEVAVIRTAIVSKHRLRVRRKARRKARAESSSSTMTEIRESLETLLQIEGYTVVVAGTGLEGLAQIRERA